MRGREGMGAMSPGPQLAAQAVQPDFGHFLELAAFMTAAGAAVDGRDA